MKTTLPFIVAFLGSALFTSADVVRAQGAGYTLGSTSWTSLNDVTKAAESGNAKAMFVLGWIYDEGPDTRENEQSSREWYRKSIDGLTQLANTGDADAMLALGELYMEGDGVTQNKAQAVAWFTKAADKNSAEGIYQLAECYDDGDGVPKDKAKARDLYKKAADMGHLKAQRELMDKDND